MHDRLADRFRSHVRRQSFVVHRIDRDTSGVIVFARDARTRDALQAQFKSRAVERVYIAVVPGWPDPPAGVWRDRLVWDETASLQKRGRVGDRRGKDAVTEYRVIESFAMRRCSSCGFTPGASTRSALKPTCTGTRSWASPATRQPSIHRGRVRSLDRPSTRISSPSRILSMAVSCESRRRCPPICSCSSNGCAAARAECGQDLTGRPPTGRSGRCPAAGRIARSPSRRARGRRQRQGRRRSACHHEP